MYVASCRFAAEPMAVLTSPTSCQLCSAGSSLAWLNLAKIDSVETEAFGPGSQVTLSASRAFTAAS